MRSRDSVPSLERTLAILELFGPCNTARRASELALCLKIPRSSAYQIIRALLTRGYLEQPRRGWLQLGRRFDDLLIACQQQRPLPEATCEAAAGMCADAFRATDGPPSAAFSWNPSLGGRVDCAPFRRPPPYRIGFSNASIRNPWRVAMLHGMLDFAQKHPHSIERFRVCDAHDDPDKQARDIEALAGEGLDLLLVSCNSSAAVERALAGVVASGIPVVAVDRRPVDDRHFQIHVAASDIALGRMTAQWMAERLHGRGAIFMLGGIAGSSPAQRRVAAAMEVFKHYPGIAVVDVVFTDWLEEKGRAAIEDLVARNGRPDGVWCDSGLQGAGALQAFLDLGLKSGIPPHTGGEVNQVFQFAARHRVPLAAVEYPASMGARALQAALDVLAGRTLPRYIELLSKVVVSRGAETASVRADSFVEEHVRWDRGADFVASHGLGAAYVPERFQPLALSASIELRP